MSIKSNELKDIPYPQEFDEEDKFEYDRLLNLSKVEHPDVFEKDRWIIHYGIIMYIRKKKGMEQAYTDEELQAIIDKYNEASKNTIINCSGDEIPYLYDKENNPIFKDDSYFFKKDDEGKIAETIANDKVTIECK